MPAYNRVNTNRAPDPPRNSHPRTHRLCFDLSRDIDLHIRSTEATHEIAIAGVTTGLIGLNEEVTWEATHFHLRLRLTTRITVFDRPHHFRDSQIQGPFRLLDHDHFFSPVNERTTRMLDEFAYASPFGWIGKAADAVFFERYMRKLLMRRNQVIKKTAESSPTAH